MNKFRFMALLISSAAGLALGVTTSVAEIACREGFQRVGADEISTPYCRDALIAEVASMHGKRVSARAVRENPVYRDELCRWVGSDPRISSICNDDNSDSHGK